MGGFQAIGIGAESRLPNPPRSPSRLPDGRRKGLGIEDGQGRAGEVKPTHWRPVLDSAEFFAPTRIPVFSQSIGASFAFGYSHWGRTIVRPEQRFGLLAQEF